MSQASIQTLEEVAMSKTVEVPGRTELRVKYKPALPESTLLGRVGAPVKWPPVTPTFCPTPTFTVCKSSC